MVAPQQPLHPVHDPRMDQLLRSSLQPHLHLRTIALRVRGKGKRSRPDEESGNHSIQHRSLVVHVIPRVHMVLFDRQGPTDQDGENDEQTLAGLTSQHCLAADNFLRGNSDSCSEVTPDAKSCPAACNSLGSLLDGRFHRSLPPSSTPLSCGNRLPARPLAFSWWRSHERDTEPSSHRNFIPVRDRCGVPVPWNIPVPVNPYRARPRTRKKGA